jgi:hypothetical protein
VGAEERGAYVHRALAAQGPCRAQLFALVIEREPQQLQGAMPFLLRHREAFLSQIRQPHAGLRAAFDAIATLDYTPGFDHCVTVVGEFLVSM